MPVATWGNFKGAEARELSEIGCQVLISNILHLSIRPGIEVLTAMGGIHKFMGWSKPVMTDSGGFQAFSLGVRKESPSGKLFPKDMPLRGGGEGSRNLIWIEERGIKFRSYVDGSYSFWTPEDSIRYQIESGSDILFALDECTAHNHDYSYTRESLGRTLRWTKRSLRYFRENGASGGLFFGIVQGGNFKDLRLKALEELLSLNLDGIGIGGYLGRDRDEMLEILSWVVPQIPKETPRHLLGIGTLKDIDPIVRLGIDTFDCIAPSKLAGTGTFYSSAEEGNMERIVRRRFQRDPSPLDPSCHCHTCMNFSRAYLHHLFRIRDPLGIRLLVIHNHAFFERLVSKYRQEG